MSCKICGKHIVTDPSGKCDACAKPRLADVMEMLMDIQVHKSCPYWVEGRIGNVLRKLRNIETLMRGGKP